ncbi:MAG: HNH endonuclease [Myxococcales bacterium]|nr:HNH endonuclease [Myxococcales bacterium]
MSADAGAIAFGEKVLALLDQGRFTATYKFAVLLGLIDLCLEGVTTTGAAPTMVTTAQLAAKVTELYWPHTVPFGGRDGRGDGEVLRQVRGGGAEILDAIVRFRAQHAPDRTAPLTRSRLAAPAAYARLVRQVEWKLVQMPLPRLQRFGAVDDRFIYDVAWGQDVRRGEFLDDASFDNRLHLAEGAGDHLVRLAGLVRPLLQRRWAADVARMNPDLIEDAALDEFLFGVDRVRLAPVVDGLRELQDGRCFYCAGPLRRPQVDHFIPWARAPLDAIENLVLADGACNGAKRDHLAAAEHVERWAARARDRARDLRAVADAARWDHGAARVLGIARASYLYLPRSSRLWQASAAFVPAEPDRLARALAA